MTRNANSGSILKGANDTSNILGQIIGWFLDQSKQNHGTGLIFVIMPPLPSGGSIINSAAASVCLSFCPSVRQFALT